MNQFPTEDQMASKVQRHSPRHRALLSISGLLVIGTIAAACGSSSGKPGGGGGGTSVTLVSTTNNSKLGTILVNNKGFTLYTLSGNAACGSACSAIWPPLLVTGSTKPILGSSVAGLGSVKVSGGAQVTYQGMRLYTFSGDKSAGQTSGQGLKDTWGTWLAVITKASTTPTTAPAGGATTTTTPPSGVGF